jgi:hypothetical protein
VYSETKVLHAEQAKVAEVRLVFCNKNNFRDKVLQEEKAKVAALEQRCAYFEHLLRQTQCAVGGGGGGGGVMRPSGISPSASLPPCLFAFLSFGHSAILNLCPFASLPLCLSLSLSFCPSAFLPICPFASLPLCVSAFLPLYYLDRN